MAKVTALDGADGVVARACGGRDFVSFRARVSCSFIL